MNTQDNKPQNVEVWLSELGLPSADRDYKPGHDRIKNLCARIEQKTTFQFLKPRLRIRVAGTNGKGSTSQFLAAAFQQSGLKVGLYTSPHIVHFHERIQVDGIAIQDNDLLSLMNIVMPLAISSETSYFETATVLAWMHFSMQKVDVEILEAGVGARLDATTALPADVGVLTPIALDHQDWLGDTLADIAIEKSYVFDGCQLMVSAQQTEEVAAMLHQRYPEAKFSGLFPFPLKALADYQKQNAGLAWEAIQQIHSEGLIADERLDLDVCQQAIQNKVIAGRLEHRSFQSHHFWLDAAHNQNAVEALLPTLHDMPSFDLVIVCTREDRDLSMCVEALQQFTRKIVVMTGKQDHDYPSIEEALDSEVLQLQSANILVLGSFITLSQTLVWMKAQEN